MDKSTLPPTVAQAVNMLLATAGTSLEEIVGSTPNRDAGRLLRVREVAQRIGVSVPTVYRMIHSGQLRPVKVGEICTRIPESQLVELAESGSGRSMARAEGER